MSTQPSTPAPAAQPGVVKDPYRAYNFTLEIKDVVQGAFTQVAGLGMNIPVTYYRAAGEHSTVRAIPGRVEYSPVTLSYGITDSTELIDWLFQAANGDVVRKNVTLALLNESGAGAVRRWDLIAAWPCAWKGAPLDALSHELAIETMTLAYDRLELGLAPGPVA